MNGESLMAICRTAGMPCREFIYEWLQEDKTFADDYARAREAQADFYADQVAEIADTEDDPNRARVRIDARKWIAGKMRPKKYGDRVDHEVDGQVTVTVKYDK